MRVLFTTWAWPSHYYPLVPIAWALRAAGHDVRMASQPELLPTMRASGLPSTVVGRDVDVAAIYRAAQELMAQPVPEPPAEAPYMTPVDPDWVAPYVTRSDRPVVQHAHKVLRTLESETGVMVARLWQERPITRSWRLSINGEIAQAMADDLLDLACTFKPDIVLFDPFTYAGPLVAKLLGVPAVRCLFGPDVPWFTKFTGWDAVQHRFGVADVDVLGDLTLDPCPPGLQFDHELPRIGYRFVPYNGLADVPRWLPEPGDRPRICVTGGTTSDRLFGVKGFLSPEVLLGCAKLADERGAELILAIASDQRHLAADLPGTVRVLESMPLDILLPTCDAIIHQGGAGTLLTALRHGLPQLILPQLIDQAANAYQLTLAGAARSAAASTTTAADLLAAGHDLLDDPSYRTHAQRLAREIAEQPAPADVVDDLVALV